MPHRRRPLTSLKGAAHRRGRHVECLHRRGVDPGHPDRRLVPHGPRRPRRERQRVHLPEVARHAQGVHGLARRRLGRHDVKVVSGK